MVGACAASAQDLSTFGRKKDEMRSFVRNDLHSLGEVEQGETANSLVLPLSLSTYSTIKQLAKA